MDDNDAEEDEEDKDSEEDDTLTSSVDRETSEHRIQVLEETLIQPPNGVNTVICTYMYNMYNTLSQYTCTLPYLLFKMSNLLNSSLIILRAALLPSLFSYR